MEELDVKARAAVAKHMYSFFPVITLMNADLIPVTLPAVYAGMCTEWGTCTALHCLIFNCTYLGVVHGGVVTKVACEISGRLAQNPTMSCAIIVLPNVGTRGYAHYSDNIRRAERKIEDIFDDSGFNLEMRVVNLTFEIGSAPTKHAAMCHPCLMCLSNVVDKPGCDDAKLLAKFAESDLWIRKATTPTSYNLRSAYVVPHRAFNSDVGDFSAPQVLKQVVSGGEMYKSILTACFKGLRPSRGWSSNDSAIITEFVGYDATLGKLCLEESVKQVDSELPPNLGCVTLIWAHDKSQLKAIANYCIEELASDGLAKVKDKTIKLPGVVVAEPPRPEESRPTLKDSDLKVTVATDGFKVLKIAAKWHDDFVCNAALSSKYKVLAEKHNKIWNSSGDCFRSDSNKRNALDALPGGQDEGDVGIIPVAEGDATTKEEILEKHGECYRIMLKDAVGELFVQKKDPVDDERRAVYVLGAKERWIGNLVLFCS